MLLMEDRQLLARYRAGEADALERIYRHYVGQVEALLRAGFTFASGGKVLRFVGYRSAFERQEAIQETFIRAFSARAREGYSGLKPFAPYLLGIARNYVIDEFRRRRRELALFVPEDGEGRTLDAAHPADLQHAPLGRWTRQRADPEREAARKALRALLREFMEELDDEALEVIQLHLIDGMSQAKVADVMRTDRNRVRKTVKETRLRLLRFMKRRGVIGSLDADEVFNALLVCAP